MATSSCRGAGPCEASGIFRAFPYCFCSASGEISVFPTVSRIGRLGKGRRRTHCRGRHAPSAVQQAGRTDGRTNVSGLLFLDDKLLAGPPVTSSWISRFHHLSPGRFRHRLLRPPQPVRPALPSLRAGPSGRPAAAAFPSARARSPSSKNGLTTHACVAGANRHFFASCSKRLELSGPVLAMLASGSPRFHAPSGHGCT